MSTTTPATRISCHTEYWDGTSWEESGDGTDDLPIDAVPTTLDQARAEAADAWDVYIKDWARAEAFESRVSRFAEPGDKFEFSCRLVWTDDDAEWDDDDRHLAIVEINAVLDDDEVVGYELGDVKLYGA